MKVIIGRNGVSARSVNDKAEISHEVAKKTALSKRSGDTVSNKNVRSVGGKTAVTNDKQPRGSPSVEAKKRRHFSKGSKPKLAPRATLAKGKKYKVLKNGVAAEKNELTKKKMRAISSRKAAKLKKAKLKKLKKQQIRFSREQSQLIGIAMDGFAAPKKRDLSKTAVKATKAVNLAKKPVETLKRQFYSRADKSDDNGVKAYKLKMQIEEYGAKGVKTAVKSGVKTAKITKRVYRKLHKPTSAELRRKLRKRVRYANHNLVAEAKFMANRALKNASKKAAQATVNAAKKAAQAAYKAAQAAAKAVASAVTKVASLIVETMPWSLIVIAAIALIVLIALMFASLFSGAGGSVAGGGAWLVDDSSNQTPEEIYEGYKEYVEQAKEVMETQAKDALKDEVTDFCNGDTTEPYRIIQYIDKNNNVTYFPASGSDSAINAMIEQFGTEDYADYMSLLFVLMTREKQQADGVSDDTIYDFDFKKEDFEEFMKTVNENSCRWGDTFVYKTAVETTGEKCPGEDCETEYRDGCKCCSKTEEDGSITEYCGGHDYCPANHTKLTVKLYTIKDYYGKDYPEIYNFTENEKTRYEASKAIIAGMLDYWEGGNN